MPSGKQIVVRFHAARRGRPRRPAGAAALRSSQTKPPVASAHAAAVAEPVRPHPSTEPTQPPQPEPRELEAVRQVQEERAAVRQVLDGVTAAVRRLEEEHRGRLDEWRRSAVELAVTIATRLVHDRVKADDFAVETVVREAAALLGPRGPFTVRLHPADLALMESRLGGKPLFGDGAGMVIVTADQSQARGECRVETGDAAVTSRLGEQLAAIREDLLRSLGDAEPGH